MPCTENALLSETESLIVHLGIKQQHKLQAVITV